jgi:hypothetical protein
MRPGAALAAFCLAARLHAGAEKVGTTSAAFVKLGSGSRPAALADAYVAASDDASGLAFNPAGMSQMLAGELQATHTEWFRGLRYEDLNAVFSLGDGGMIGATFNFLSVPSITRTEQVANTSDPSQNFREVGSFSPFDMQFGLAYSRPLYPSLLGGLNLKVLSQSIDDRSTLGLGLDLGALYTLSAVKGLSLGLAAQNLGTPIKLRREAFDLPMLLRFGAAWKLMDENMLLLAEADLPSDVSPVLALALEYNFNNRFFPRVGWRYNSLFNPWTVGLGTKFDALGLDLSIVPFGELGLTYRATLSYKFGAPGAELLAKIPYLSSAASGKGLALEAKVSAPDKVAAWGLFIYDSARPPKLARQLQGRGAMPGLYWDGKLDGGAPAPEGAYWAILTVRYATGKSVSSKYLRLEVNNTPPQAELSLDPSSLNPQAAGEAYIPTQFRSNVRGRAPSAWRLEILDPQAKIFHVQRGEGMPPAEGLLWEGKDDQGEALVSGQIYQARLVVSDPLGNESSSPVISFRAVFR